MSQKLRLFPLLLLILSSSFTPIFSQGIGINSTGAPADPSAALDLNATNQGVLIPRVALTAVNAATPVISPATSLLVYNTATAGTAPNEVFPGYYYWTGNSWQRLLTQAGTAQEGWSLSGNSGTNPANHFLGTADNQPLVIKVNGQQSGYISSNPDPNLILGYQALYSNVFGKNNTAIGYKSLFSNSSGNYNSAIGNFTLYFNSSGSNNTAVGDDALRSNTTGESNSALGSGALSRNTSGGLNTAVGVDALLNNSIGFGNSAMGQSALIKNTTGSYNSALGSSALANNTTGSDNAATGAFSMLRNSTGFNNAAMGNYALYINTTGSNNSAFGYNTLYSNTSGSTNSAMGGSALYFNTTGNNNVAMGYLSLLKNTTGNNNTAVGSSSGPTIVDLNNTSSLGASAVPTASNYIRIGNTAIGDISGQVAWSNTSDKRFKVDVKENVKGLDFILRLRPVTYHWDIDSLNRFIYGDRANILFTDSAALAGIAAQESITYTGFLAQEVEAAAKSIGYDFSGVVAPANEKTPYSIRYAEFVVPLVKAVQEQNNQLGQHKELLVGLRSQFDRTVVRLTSAKEWADRVFEPGYRLRLLSEVEKYMLQHKHLPGVPSAQELSEKGIDVANMLSIQMEKIEEQTLYLVELEKKNKVLEERIEKLNQIETENKEFRKLLLDIQKELKLLSTEK